MRLMCGVCSLGLGLAEWRLRLRLLLNIMLQPGTVHLCISRRCTAEKWILSAPLSQNVFRHTLHWTRFLPVLGLTKEVPRSSNMASNWRLDSSGRLPGPACSRSPPRWLGFSSGPRLRFIGLNSPPCWAGPCPGPWPGPCW